jgi:hypothetical protein
VARQHLTALNLPQELADDPGEPECKRDAHPRCRGRPFDQARGVLRWQPDWTQYDQFYRPLIFNPYREPLQVV